MSSSPLYLAIVVVWILVLVPMLLRRDAADPAADDLRHESVPDTERETADADDGHGQPPSPPEETDVVHEAAESPPPAPARPVRASRAALIARRRRRTSALVLLLAATGAAVALGLGPWWVLAPPAVLMAGHLVLLREAARADAERRAAELARRRARLRARRAAEAAREAEIVEFINRRDQVYDQYTDAHRRAAGD